MTGSKVQSSTSVTKRKTQTTKPTKPTNSAKQPLSQEFVHDSEDSSEATNETPISTKYVVNERGLPKPSTSTSANGTSSATKVFRKPKSHSPVAPRADINGSASKSRDSSEDEDETGSDTGSSSSEESPTPVAHKRAIFQDPKTTHPDKPTANGAGPLTSTQKSGTAYMPNSYGKPAGNVHQSSEESESGSEIDSESGSASESVLSVDHRISQKASRRSSPLQNILQGQVPHTYEPPTGFQSASISLHPASRIDEIFAPSHLAGKQIWHITAPASVPLTSVKEVSSKIIADGGSILTYKKTEYGLVPNADSERPSGDYLLLPSIKTNDYKPSRKPIVRTLHLQQLVSLPSHMGPHASSQSDQATAPAMYRKPPRPQPQGLRMRYHPFGVSDEPDPETLATAKVAQTPQFRRPDLGPASSQIRKRKRPESVVEVADAGIVNGKPRKRSLEPSQQSASLDGDTTMDDASQEVPLPSSASQIHINGISSNVDTPNGKEIKEERRKRRMKRKAPEPIDSHPPTVSALPADILEEAATIMPEEVVETNTNTNHITSPPLESLDEQDRKKNTKTKKPIKATKEPTHLSDHDSQMKRDDAVQSSSQMGVIKETKEERAKRKEEKRRKKLAARET